MLTYQSLFPCITLTFLNSGIQCRFDSYYILAADNYDTAIITAKSMAYTEGSLFAN